MKIGAAAALVGAVVAEVTKSEDGGLGARLLAGSYYGQTVQIWAALFAAAALSAALVGLIGLVGAADRAPHGARAMSRRLNDLFPPACFRPRGARALGGGGPAPRCAGDHSAAALRDRDEAPDLGSDARRRFPADDSRRACWLRHRLRGRASSIAILIDRSQFLQRGLMPIGNLVSALPIVGIAPIMVMWFGFDWQSKAAVVVVMTFFPMLVNTVAGLASAGAMERDS